MATSCKTRDRSATSKRLVEAVETLLAREGFRGLGINALAREAGVDKVLIYRYFGGLSQLIAAYAEEGDLWWIPAEIIGPDLPPPEDDTLSGWLTLVLQRHMAALKRRPLTVEILAWGLVERNALTEALNRVQERRGQEVLAHIFERFPPADWHRAVAWMALLGAATDFLVLRAQTAGYFLVDSGSERGWHYIENAVSDLVHAAFDRDAPGGAAAQ